MAKPKEQYMIETHDDGENKISRLKGKIDKRARLFAFKEEQMTPLKSGYNVLRHGCQAKQGWQLIHTDA
jgi:hypothetical protein